MGGLGEEVEARSAVATAAGTTVAGAAAAPAAALKETLSASRSSSGASPGEDGAAAAVFEEFEGYRLVAPLGSGGMGEVYLAHDTVLDRLVAVKFIRGLAPGAGRRARFQREARAIARLQHANVVAIYRAGEVDGRPYIVSELVRGGSLDRVALPLAPNDLLRVCTGLAAGLAAAHRRGVLHRDLKPANALLSEDGEVKLCDFGLAKLLEDEIADLAASLPAPTRNDRDLTRQSTRLGTPRYMAPELWSGAPATVQSDLYALGAMFYELACGRPAIGGMSLEELRATRRSAPVTPLAQVAPGIDPRLEALVRRCLRPAPAERPRSADEVHDAMVAMAAPASPPRPRPWRSRFVLALALIAVALAALWLAWPRQPPPAAPAGPRARLLGHPDTIEPGWTALAPFRHAGGAHVIAYDAQSGRVEFDRLTTDGTGVQPRWKGRWAAGLSHVVPYVVAGEPHFLAYDAATGLVLFEQVRPDLQGALVLGAATWPTGVTLVTPAIRDGRSYMYLYQASTGAVWYERLDERGAAATQVFVSNVPLHDVTQLVGYNVGDQAHVVAYVSIRGDLHYYRVDASGLVSLGGNGFDRGDALALLDAPGPPRMLAYSPMSGAARVLTVAADGAGAMPSPPVQLAARATSVVPFDAAGTDVLLYDGASGRLEAYELSRP
jgi:hypothetical protein